MNSLKNTFSDRDLVEAGVDEAGRGCLAGPVCVAAVILPNDIEVPSSIKIRDSKKMTALQRTKSAEWIKTNCLAYTTYMVEVDIIDRVNILQASLWGMTQAVARLDIQPELILIDGPHYHPPDDTEYHCIIKGDGTYLSIAAASIIAKTTRDDFMVKLHIEYPEYCWNMNKAYGTRLHKEAIREHGLCVHHRKSFKTG